MPAAQPLHPQQLYGRVVQLGAFRDYKQGSDQWRAIVRADPALAQAHPSAIQNRDWNGRFFYQFEVGTGSLADSQSLCQSMAQASFRCTIVGLPWAHR